MSIVAIDFDGTVVNHEFPVIGQELPGALNTMRAMQKAGHKIIIWTCRCGKEIAEMVAWFTEKNFVPDAINSNIGLRDGYGVPKIYADFYFDDRGFPPFSGWDSAYEKFVMETRMKKRK